MSFDLAFWVGARPSDDRAALEEFRSLCERHAEGGEPSDPHPTLLAFIADVTQTYPDLMDLPDERVDQGIWADGPLTVTGPRLYVGIRWSRAAEVAAFLTTRAAKFGLVVFDPQSGELGRPTLQ